MLTKIFFNIFIFLSLLCEFGFVMFVDAQQTTYIEIYGYMFVSGTGL